MDDILKIKGGWLGAAGAAPFGLTSISDGKGNSERGLTLTCAGKPINLNVSDWFILGGDLSDVHSKSWSNAFALNGEWALGSLENPLKHMCNDIKARGHHTLVDLAAYAVLGHR